MKMNDKVLVYCICCRSHNVHLNGTPLVCPCGATLFIRENQPICRIPEDSIEERIEGGNDVFLLLPHGFVE